jgi:hypothetical protein
MNEVQFEEDFEDKPPKAYTEVLNLRHSDGSGRLLRVNAVWWYRFLKRLERNADRLDTRAKVPE